MLMHFILPSFIPWGYPNAHRQMYQCFIFLNGCEEKKKDIINFLLEYYLELPTETFGYLLQENTTTAKTDVDRIFEPGPASIFYISGFIVTNLKKVPANNFSVSRGETSVIRKTVFKTENSSFVTKFDAWLKKKSRRGPLRLVSIWSCGSWKSSWWDFWTKATCSASRCKVKESVVESL